MGSFQDTYNDPLILHKVPATCFEASQAQVFMQFLGSRVNYSINKEFYYKMFL